jgi:hypothetical protein
MVANGDLSLRISTADRRGVGLRLLSIASRSRRRRRGGQSVITANSADSDNHRAASVDIILLVTTRPRADGHYGTLNLYYYFLDAQEYPTSVRLIELRGIAIEATRSVPLPTALPCSATQSVNADSKAMLSARPSRGRQQDVARPLRAHAGNRSTGKLAGRARCPLLGKAASYRL